MFILCKKVNHEDIFLVDSDIFSIISPQGDVIKAVDKIGCEWVIFSDDAQEDFTKLVCAMKENQPVFVGTANIE